MPTNIDNTDLRSIAQFILSYTPPFYSVVTDFLKDLYVTGCRPHELLDQTRWTDSIIDPDYYTLTPEKGNNDREILKSSLSSNLRFAIDNNILPYQDLSLRQLEYSIQQINPIGRMFAETKEIIAYLYRYNKVRELLDNGYTQNQVSDYFGWVSPTIIATYTIRQLSVQDNLIPAETYDLWNDNLDIIIDSNGDLVVSE